MVKVSEFEPQLAALLPATHALLSSANVTVHPDVSRIILHGSRGPAGGYRPDSDIDLSLIVETRPAMPESDLAKLLREVINTTLTYWQGSIQVDLAAIFDVQNCGLKCFDQGVWDELLCATGGVDCFGLYKIQKGYRGFVKNAGVQVKQMYPCLKIWQRE